MFSSKLTENMPNVLANTFQLLRLTPSYSQTPEQISEQKQKVLEIAIFFF